MLNDQNLRNELLHLLAITNNFIMDLEVKGDNTLKAADIMSRCHLLFNYINPKEPTHGEEEKTDSGGPSVGDGNVIGQND